MTAVFLPPAPARRAERFTGLAVVLRLSFRRERWPLLFWALGVVGTVVSSVNAIAGLYPTPANRSDLATTIAANPAFLALTGQVTSTSIGGLTAWRVGVLGGSAVALMGVLTVIRRTRADEEAGRAELLASGVVGRDTLLTSGLVVAWSAAAAIGLVCAAGLLGNGQPVEGSLALGAALVGPGLVFGGIAAVCAQVFDSARAAAGAAGAALGAAFALRAAGDLSAGGSWFSWLSPLGWSQKVDAFGLDRWWVLLLFVASAAALAVAAHALSVRRDLGRGIFAVRLGPAESVGLRSGLALAFRLHRASWVGWSVGFLLLGLVTGSLANTAGSLLGGNPQLAALIRDLGGDGALSDQLLAVMAQTCALMAAGYVVSASLRIRSEETTGRAELALSTGLSRGRWFGGHVFIAACGSALLMLIAGLAAGLLYAAETGRFVSGFNAGFWCMAIQIPAVLVVGALTAALIGWVPRFAVAGWAVLGGSVLMGQLGALLSLPRWLVNLSPFSHIPLLPAADLRWAPLIALVVVAGAATAVGFTGFARRDIG